MALVSITFRQVLVLFLLIFVGFICTKFHGLNQNHKEAFTALLMNVILPLLVVNSYLSGFDPAMAVNLLKAFAWSFLAIFFSAAITLLFTKRRSDSEVPLLRFGCTFSNAAYMGLPLVDALYGAEGLIYASAYASVFTILIWTLGIFLVGNETNKKEMLRSIRSTPMIYAIIVGIAIYFLQIPIPDVIKQPIGLISSMNTPLSMLIIGIPIASSSLKKLFRNKDVWFATCLRVFIIPLATLVLFKLLGLLGIVARVVLLQASCPVAAISSVFAVRYHHNEEAAAGYVMVSTLVSILTLPMVSVLTNIYI